MVRYLDQREPPLRQSYVYPLAHSSANCGDHLGELHLISRHLMKCSSLSHVRCGLWSNKANTHIHVLYTRQAPIIPTHPLPHTADLVKINPATLWIWMMNNAVDEDTSEAGNFPDANLANKVLSNYYVATVAGRQAEECHARGERTRQGAHNGSFSCVLWSGNK